MSRFERAVQLSEIIGAIAVVVSLLYVGTEIRQNTEATRLGMHQSSIAMGVDWMNPLYADDFAEVYTRGLADLSALTPAERIKFRQFVTAGLNIWEFAHYSHRKGMMDAEIWQGWDGYFSDEITQPAWREIWREARRGYGEGFRSYVDSVVTSAGG